MNFLPASSTLILFTSFFKTVLKFNCSRKHSHWSLGPGLNILFLGTYGCRYFKVIWLLLLLLCSLQLISHRPVCHPTGHKRSLLQKGKPPLLFLALSLCPLSMMCTAQRMLLNAVEQLLSCPQEFRSETHGMSPVCICSSGK